MNRAPAGTWEQADLYRRLHGGNPGDVEFYLSACSGADTVLELGSGAGRILARLARAGHRVTGVELNPHLMTFAADAVEASDRDRVTLLETDMSELALPDRFDRVLIPFTGLYALPTLEAMRRCLTAAREHLSPEGLLICDMYAVDDAECGPRAPEETAWEVTHELSLDDGQTVVVWERNRFDGTPCRVDVDYRFQWPDGRVTTDTIAHHFLSRDGLEDLLADSGFTEVDIRGGFDGSEFDLDSPLMVAVASG